MANFLKGTLLLNYFALHKKSKNYGTRSLYLQFFENLGQNIFKGIFEQFPSFIHTGWHRQHKLF
jgi:hypothetical protein